jgi:adenosylcobinamide-phosphate synthase
MSDRSRDAHRRRTWAIPLALVLDAALSEPPNWLHPVVGIGHLSGVMERRAPRSGPAALVAGAALTGVAVGGSALAAWLATRLIKHLPWPLALLAESWLLKTMLSVRALVEAGADVERPLTDGDLPAARAAVGALVSRDPSALTQEQLTSAAIESLAENTADSIVAPLAFYAVGGLPAAFAYRAANTLDAMIGYRGEYEDLGKVAARLDDVLNLIPARLSSALLLAAGAIWGGTLPTGLGVTIRDHGQTASPNAGWPMSTMAGLLYTRLEKPGHYVLGDDLEVPDLSAIDHAGLLVVGATILTVPTVLGVRWLAGRLRPYCRLAGPRL